MKTSLLKLLLFISIGFLNSSIHAQSKADDAAFKTLWKNIWTAFESGDNAKMFDYYTDQACEITPDGNMTCGKKALIENWTFFMKMLDEKPKFTYSEPTLRYLTPDVLIATWESNDDIKLKGKQIGGKTKSMAVVHKINGKWLIEFDSFTPVIQMHPN